MKNSRLSYVITGVGAWKLNSNKDQAFLTLLRDKTFSIISKENACDFMGRNINKDKIRRQLFNMGARNLTELKPTQYITMFNFLQKL